MDPTSQPNDLFQDYLQTLVGRAYRYDFQLKDDTCGQLLLKASPQAQCRFIRLAVAWLASAAASLRSASPWGVLEAISALLRRTLPFEQEDLIALLRCGAHQQYAWRIEAHFVKVIGNYLADNPHTPALDSALAEYVAALEARTWSADQRRRLLRLRELAGITQQGSPLAPGDVWSDAASAA
jgi:hypothetical protein